MQNKKYRIYRFFVNLLGILLFFLILNNVSLPDLSSLSAYNPAEREVDFCSTDFYQMVADGRKEKILDDKIVIVPIDELSRKDIRQLLEDINLCNPLAIGLDVFFQFSMQDDDKLLDVLRQTPKLIAPMGVRPNADNVCDVMDAYLLDSIEDAKRGIVNMNIEHRYNVVRDFKPFYQTDRGELSHFVLAIAQLVDSVAVGNISSRIVEDVSSSVCIDFVSREFEKIAPFDVLERIDDIEGKIVLLGAVEDAQDIHITPIDDSMPGILIHAYALSTVLRQHHKAKMPSWALWLMGIFISAIFVGSKIALSNIIGGGTLMRLFQTVLLILIVYIGCVLYIKLNFVLELTLPLAVVGLGFIALDYWNDFCKLIIKIINKMNIRFFKSLLSVLILLGIVSVDLQAAPYRIFKFEGDVKILQQGTWVEVTNGQEVIIRDQFLLGEEAKLGIVDYDTRRIYYTNKSGKQNVAQIISKARKDADAIASNMRKQLSASGDVKNIPILGGVNRGFTAQTDATINIYSDIYHHLNGSRDICEDGLTAEIVKDGKSYHFKIKNSTSKPLFVNVIKLPRSDDEKHQLCLEVGYTENEPYLIIAPETEIELNHYVFLADDVAPNYLLFACEEPYDCQALKMLLNVFAPPHKSGHDNKKILYFNSLK